MMDVEPRQLKMLVLGTGRCPFEDWYRSIRDTTTRVRIRTRLVRIRNGNFGDCKPVGQGVNELRLDFGPGYRVYYVEVDEVIVVLLVGGDKSSQSSDIKRAQELWVEYKDVLKDFNDIFADELRDPEFVAAHLDEALHDGLSTFLVAMQDVAKANGGMTLLSGN
jgi:putative addiction module killer protein